MVKIILTLLVLGHQLSAQTAISGTIHLEGNSKGNINVFLVKMDMNHIENLKYSKPVSWSQINEDGTFSFDRKHVSERNTVYNLYVTRVEKAIHDTILFGKPFILSSSDRIDFKSSDGFIQDYSTSSLADQEWKKLKEFEGKLLKYKLSDSEEHTILKSYTKDSLQILMVKLISIRQLDNKQLLDQDIDRNPDYYLALLGELKESGIPVEQYEFLQKKLAFLTQEIVERKYAWSKALNLVLGFFAIGLGFMVFFRKKRQPFISVLSKQERTVQELILQGKSNKEIANELFISISTVKTHITNIYTKLEVSGRPELFQKFKIGTGTST